MVVRLRRMAWLWSTVAAGGARLSAAQPVYVLAVLGLYIVSIFITGARWRGFLRALGHNVSVVQAALATLGGIAAGNLTPSRLGTEPCRVALIRLAAPVTWGQVTRAAAWDRLSEAPAIVILVIMSALAARRIDVAWRNGVVLVVIAGAMVAIVIAVARLRRSRASLRTWVGGLGLEQITPRVFAAGVGYSALLWLQDVVRLACAGLAVGVHLSPTQTAMLAVSTIVGGLVPTIGGLVVVEGGLVAALMAFGVDLPTAMAATAVERAVSFGFSTVAGGLIAGVMGGRSLWTLAVRSSRRTLISQSPASPPTRRVPARHRQ